MEVSARIVRIGLRLRPLRHGLDVQVLHGDENVGLGEARGGLLDPVVAATNDMALQGIELSQGPLTPLGGEFGGPAAPGLVGPVLAGHPALEVFQPLQLGLRRLGHVPEGPVGRGERMHATAVQADNAVTRSRQWQGHVDEHERLVGPVDMDAGVGSYRLACAHVDDDTPVELLAGLDPSWRVHAGDDDHTGLPAGLVEDGVACLVLVTPADEVQAAMTRLETGNTASDGLLPLEPGGPFGVLDPIGGRQYGIWNPRHPRALETHLLVRE